MNLADARQQKLNSLIAAHQKELNRIVSGSDCAAPIDYLLQLASRKVALGGRGGRPPADGPEGSIRQKALQHEIRRLEKGLLPGQEEPKQASHQQLLQGEHLINYTTDARI